MSQSRMSKMTNMLSQRLRAGTEALVEDMKKKNLYIHNHMVAKYNDDLKKNSFFMRRSKDFSAIYLWFMAINVLYTSLKYTIPYVGGEVFGLDPWTLYWFKVVIAFGFIQITANWTCVRCYDSYYEVSEDRPELQKTLWDEHPLEKIKIGEDKKDEELKSQVEVAPPGKRQPGRWHFCAVCQRDTPPRAHHCKVCRKCTLKRDHHCFIVGTCIGYHNQRYFVMLVFYLMVCSGICLSLAYFYLRDHMWSNSGLLDYFLPCTLYKWLWTGSLQVQHFFVVTHLYTFTWIGPMCMSFFILQLLAIGLGKTMHEFTRDEPIKVVSSVSENFRSVFGPFWGFNFIMPAVILFRQPGDGIHWPKVYLVVKRPRPELEEVKSRTQ